MIGKTGDDIFGLEIRRIMAEYGSGLDHDLVVDKSTSTSYTVIISPPGIDRIFLHSPGANDTFNSLDIPFERFSEAALFHFGYPPMMRQVCANNGDELVNIFRQAKQTGITTSLDMCMPDPKDESGRVDWQKILTRTLPYVDIFVPSFDEILFMLDRPLYQDLLQSQDFRALIKSKPGLLSELGELLINMGAKIVMIKLGNCGAYLRTAEKSAVITLGRAQPQNIDSWVERELWAPCFQVQVVGTTGSGDSTIAGFLCGLLRGLPPEAALKSGVAVGAFNVEAPDALSGIPAWESVQRRILAGWETLDACIAPQPWQWSAKYGLWTSASDASLKSN